MRTYLDENFWSDPEIEELSPSQKLAFIWAISNPSCDLCGITKVSPRRFEFETGLKIDDLRGAYKGLRRSLQAPCEGVVFAKNYVRHQFGQGANLKRSNMAKSILKHLAKHPPEVVEAFIAEYPEIGELLEGACKPPEKEKEKEKEKETNSEALEIYKIYPLKKAKPAALKAIGKALKKTDSETLKKSIKNYQAECERTQTPFAYPATWFNQERWEDEPTQEPKKKEVSCL